jgi:hypothetical protein
VPRSPWAGWLGFGRWVAVTYRLIDGTMTPMIDESQTPAAYAQTLQTAYANMLASDPHSMSAAEELLVAELDSHGISLSSDIVRALSWAAVEGPEA